MSSNQENFVEFIAEMIPFVFIDQWSTIKEEWEPGLTHALGSVADECHKLIRKEMQAWKGDAATLADAGWEIRRKASMAHITAERTEVVAELLAEMVSDVAKETGEILTINGLSGESPSLETLHPDPNAAAQRLSGGAALDHTVSHSFVWYVGRVFSAIIDARQAQSGRRPLEQSITSITDQWRSRLETIASTVLHAAYNRAKHTISSGLA